MKLTQSIPWLLFVSLRPRQWIKNLVIFAAIIFNGQLFHPLLFTNSLLGFVVFCLLSSAGYLINDVLDLPYDRLHPQKKYRPVVSGKLSVSLAIETAILLSLAGFIISLLISFNLFLLGLVFIAVTVLYSLGLKRISLLDILLIAGAFIIRAFAGEIITGYHLPVWLMLTIIFVSLFIASGKRRSELVLEGARTRPALLKYRTQLLDIYTSTFATASLISYALFTFFSEPVKFSEGVTQFLLATFPGALGRKWLMAATFPFVIFGIMRYTQLVYEKRAGEKPEKVLTHDIPIFLALIGWGLTVIAILYIV